MHGNCLLAVECEGTQHSQMGSPQERKSRKVKCSLTLPSPFRKLYLYPNNGCSCECFLVQAHLLPRTYTQVLQAAMTIHYIYH